MNDTPPDFSAIAIKLGVDESLLQQKIEQVFAKYSSRVWSPLLKDGIEYIGYLVQNTEQELIRTKGIGRKSLNAVKEVMSSMGLPLGLEAAQTIPAYLQTSGLKEAIERENAIIAAAQERLRRLTWTQNAGQKLQAAIMASVKASGVEVTESIMAKGNEFVRFVATQLSLHKLDGQR